MISAIDIINKHSTGDLNKDQAISFVIIQAFNKYIDTPLSELEKIFASTDPDSFEGIVLDELIRDKTIQHYMEDSFISIIWKKDGKFISDTNSNNPLKLVHEFLLRESVDVDNLLENPPDEPKGEPTIKISYDGENFTCEDNIGDDRSRYVILSLYYIDRTLADMIDSLTEPFNPERKLDA